MRLGMVLLCMSYMLSQFYRAFLAILTDVLEADLGAGADDLAFASGMWFLSFAAMQIPIGEALDRWGPRRTASILLALGGGGGAALFALATTPAHIAIAMALIGAGSAPVLMASYFIFARMFEPRMFATFGALMVGIGSLGNLASSVPLALLVEAVGWRASLFGLSALSLLVAGAVWLWVKDPPQVEGSAGGSVLDVLKIRALWFIFPMIFVGYAAPAGIRGLWIGPYIRDIYADAGFSVGTATLLMAVAMICGTLLYGPLDRVFGTRKWVIVGGMVISLTACAALAAFPTSGYWLVVALCCAIGTFGAAYPMMMAHGRAFLPAHLTGRGVTLLNLFSIGGAGVMQVLSGKVHSGAVARGAIPAEAYSAVFALFAVAVAAGLLIYVFSRDRVD